MVGPVAAGARSRLSRLLLAAMFLLATGCVSRTVATGAPPSAFDPAAGVAVVFARAGSPTTGDGTAREMVDCVHRALRDTRPEVRLVPVEDFLRAAFPGLSAVETPLSPESLVELLRADDWRTHLLSAGVRYLVVLRGGTIQPKPWGDVSCVAIYGGAGCFGYLQWERDSQFGASIFDLKNATAQGEVDVKVSGRPWFLVVGIFPLGAPSFTEGWACNKLGSGVARFLRPGGTAP